MNEQESEGDRYCILCHEIATLALRTSSLHQLHMLAPDGSIGQLVDEWTSLEGKSRTVYLCHDHARALQDGEV